MSKKEINHENTFNIVCPFCGYEDYHSAERDIPDDDTKIIECGSCGEQFYALKSVQITYFTEIPRRDTCSVCGEKNVIVESYHGTIGDLEHVGVHCCMDKELTRLRKEDWERLKNK